MSLVNVFKNKIVIETEIDAFLDLASESGLLFTQGIQNYLKGKLDSFEDILQQSVEAERHADSLRRSIEDLLYRRTLIPESRGDVLRIIEHMDSLLGEFKGSMWRLQIERPKINNEFADDFLSLTDLVVKSVEAVIVSIRGYFKDLKSVSDHIHKVSFWEREADKVATDLQIKVFRCESLKLSQKLQLRALICQIEDISDMAEDVSDSLAIAVIKRSL